MPGNNRRNAGRKSQGAGASRVVPAETPGPSPHASIAGDPETIRFLNAVLKNELTAIN
jgi:hypothetical protein